MSRDRRAVQGSLDRPSGTDERGQILGSHAQPEHPRWNEGVERPAPCDIDLDAARVDAPGGHAGGHVDEGDLLHRAGRTTHSSRDAPRRYVDHHLDLAVIGGRDAAGFHRPGA